MTDLLTSTNGLAERVTTPTADWFVRLIDGRVVLTPSEGWQANIADQGGPSGAPSQFVIGSANDRQIGALLSDALRRIARARNLMRLASAGGAGPRVDLRVARHATASDTGGRPLLSKPGDVSIRAGEFAEFRIANTGNRSVDVTVLYIDAAFGIHTMYPLRDREVDNQLKPGEARVIGRFQVTDMPLGWESAVAIAVESTTVRQNFAMLAQESLETRRGNEPKGEGGSPLQQLLESAVFGTEGRTRGSGAVSPGSFVVKLVTWRTDPAAR
jgi:hypothetical protein